MPEIGTTLREARMRARIDVSEIEEQTKIRARYLRALENEEWGLLPGPTYTKSFLRAYAQALGLDSRALVDEYRARFEQPREPEWAELTHQPAGYGPRRISGRPRMPARPRVPARARQRGAALRPRRSRLLTAGAVCIFLLVLFLVIGLVHGSPSPRSLRSAHAGQPGRHGHGGAGHVHSGAVGTASGASTAHGARSAAATGATGAGRAAAGGTVTLTLRPTGRVWVCLLGDHGRKLIPGRILLPGNSAVAGTGEGEGAGAGEGAGERGSAAEAPGAAGGAGPQGALTFHGRLFKLNLGDNAVEMSVNGRRQALTPSARPRGYEISASGVSALPAGQIPTCA